MIRRYTFGSPLPTDAVVRKLPAETGALPVFDMRKNEDGSLSFSAVYTMPAKTDIETVSVDTTAVFSPNEAIPGNDAFSYDNAQYTIGGRCYDMEFTHVRTRCARDIG